MVKIIKGTYLCKDKKGFRRSITAKDGPQTFDKEEEARLVSLGVAEYVTGSTEPAKVEPKAEKVIVKEERPPVVAKPAKAKAKNVKQSKTIFFIGCQRLRCEMSVQRYCFFLKYARKRGWNFAEQAILARKTL